MSLSYACLFCPPTWLRLCGYHLAACLLVGNNLDTSSSSTTTTPPPPPILDTTDPSNVNQTVVPVGPFHSVRFDVFLPPGTQYERNPPIVHVVLQDFDDVML